MAYVHKPLPVSVARNLLYLLKVMHEAIVLNPPKSMSEAKLMLSNFELICAEGVKEAESALAPDPVAELAF